MKVEIIKFELKTGFDCVPVLTAMKYEDDMLEGGRVYKNLKGIRDENNTIRINEIWMNYDDKINTPYWSSFVIVEQDIEKEDLIDIITNLYNTNRIIITNSKDSFIYRLKKMKTPEENDIIHQLRLLLNNNSDLNTFTIKRNDFNDEVIEKIKAYSTNTIISEGLNLQLWKEYLAEQDILDRLNNYISRLKILKLTDKTVEFQRREVYKFTIEEIAKKIATDLYYEYIRE